MYPFRNLAFQGGGTKALAYHGAVRVLEEAGILAQIERVAGTSAGATLATLLSMRLDMDEIQRAYASFDVNDFQESLSGRPPDGAPPPRILGRLQDNISSMSRLATRYGWYSLAYYYEWLQDALSIYCKGYERATFAQFRSWGFRDLYIVVTNLTKRRTELFCADRTPDVAVVDALVMSQSLPLFFEGLQYDGQQFGHGDYYGDGGLILNYPLPLFDDRSFAHNNHWYVNGVNWESLGFRLYRPDDCPHYREPINSLLTYIQSMLETLAESQSLVYEISETMQRRTVRISDCCVKTTDFSISPTDDDEHYRQLVNAGEVAARRYLAAYQPPLVKPLLPISFYLDRLAQRMRAWSARREDGG